MKDEGGGPFFSSFMLNLDFHGRSNESLLSDVRYPMSEDELSSAMLARRVEVNPFTGLSSK